MSRNQDKRKIIQYAACRLAEMLVILLLLSVIVFVLSRLCPGDPLRSWYGDGVDRMSEAAKARARHNLGLDRSLLTQYGIWLKDLLQGNLGLSYKYKRPVTAVLQGVMGNTLILVLLTYVLTFGLAFRIGWISASKEGTRLDRFICKTGVVSGNIPVFFLSLIGILVFAVWIPILPTGGAYSYGSGGNLVDRLWHLILPVTVMVIGHLWYYAYMVRNLLLEEMRKEYVLLLKAEGVPRRDIIRKYCMKNIMPPMVTAMAMAVPHLLGGTYVVETVFSYPGMGRLCFESALYKDYNLLMATTLLTGAVVVLCNYLAQVMGERIDPRMGSGEDRYE